MTRQRTIKEHPLIDRKEPSLIQKEHEMGELRRDIIEECIRVVRDNCSICGGSGIGRYEPERYVSRDMALDAEQLKREGSLYSTEICEECEYCGRPIEAIRTLLEDG